MIEQAKPPLMVLEKIENRYRVIVPGDPTPPIFFDDPDQALNIAAETFPQGFFCFIPHPLDVVYE